MSEYNIYHIFHSGTALKFNNRLFIFDYYRTRKREDIQQVFPSFSKLDSIFVFASHGHPDHYSKEIFNWSKLNSSIKYILSSDIFVPENVEQQAGKNISKMAADEKNSFENIEVRTLGSTDRGVSFLVMTENANFFHCGDLNWWHWKSFSEKKLAREEENFKKEVEKLAKMKLKIEIAFVPVDPRLEEHYYLAGRYFSKVIEPEILVPIHFENKYQIVDKFREKVRDLSVKVPKIQKHQYCLT